MCPNTSNDANLGEKRDPVAKKLNGSMSTTINSNMSHITSNISNNKADQQRIVQHDHKQYIESKFNSIKCFQQQLISSNDLHSNVNLMAFNHFHF